MTFETSKAAAGGNGAALGNAVHGQAISIREFIPSPLDLQASFIARRTRLPLSLARIVAELAFVGRAA